MSKNSVYRFYSSRCRAQFRFNFHEINFHETIFMKTVKFYFTAEYGPRIDAARHGPLVLSCPVCNVSELTRPPFDSPPPLACCVRRDRMLRGTRARNVPTTSSGAVSRWRPRMHRQPRSEQGIFFSTHRTMPAV